MKALVVHVRQTHYCIMSLKDLLFIVDSSRDGTFVDIALGLFQTQEIAALEHLDEANAAEWAWSAAVSGGMRFFF